ncbi:23S rRNA (adenine(2503)-C(2))-methyltransferase RlmN [Gilvimarinus agarilyticus]|uniref:23S rRNA (adenine(2503)-C(2))-methyltransferase RlmN n=1 Tax=Reichenbachiella TaxID=156993 RepID=UPI000E6BFA4E|nr:MULTISPECIES: 23S rRNA (adenine(2503)-C(2))-methyltransferase RlmN [Reichenbachiella]MBU2888013.1 23S rRNA (adenine(2503)-C(2))-methyltransferase RlmN [Gilvimarinus agarilyticus]MBU2915636.1 23S rRNA (adenine(2503)-C(2))-methyltransferase RlmN [Reichenbachiella agariperforans]RJE72088.1 23S rRNA (adenine(2503)-C(2))-methyltransferase [Reichenbachiella sp. MSK19-1]
MNNSAGLKDLRKVPQENISVFLKEIGEKPFRAKQIKEWIWKKSVKSIDDMTNISLATRTKLKEHFVINPVTVDKEQKSNDGTIKSAMKLFDDHVVESVLIPADSRMTACVSSQVGCSLSCKFCATGYMDRARNLDASEIYDQVVAVNNQSMENYNIPLSNIVYMGMGEPLLNYANVLESIKHITSPEGLNMSPKRITVSTAGISKMIKKLADDQVKFNLALSLHAANDEKRNKIMPINESNNLDVLRESLNYFYQKTGNKITFEYILFYDFNDSEQDAQELYEFWKRVPARINIIEYNPISEASYKNADENTLDTFIKYLETRGVNVHVRRSRGKDIDAACGQLANKN